MTSPASLAELGFRWPAEWELQKQVFFGWPSIGEWFRNNAGPVQEQVVGVATALSQFQPVTVCANPHQVQRAREMLPAHIRVLEVPHETPYIRDTAPLFVVRPSPEDPAQNEVTAIGFKFNAYGGIQKEDGSWWTKYGTLYATDLQDARVAATLAASEGVPLVKADFVLEGGSVHTDGEGTLVTTAECLLHKNRNPDLTKEQIEAQLQKYLAIEKVIWLPKGVYADFYTNGHVDNFCCFVKPGAVLLAWTNDKSDPQYEISVAALEVLQSTTDAKGRSLEVFKVPLPPNLFITQEEADGLLGEVKKRDAGARLPASYVNFYLANGGAVIPAFGVETDEPARLAIQAAFGESRKVVSVPAREILLGGGDIHCMSMQQPAGVPAAGL
ncbi:agmatine deiminase [Coccomyxa subellipsoidea C-169]|uniref:Agmatine deiminase n=1 Tax=Coccomyxa subellipsoidea (strain C-169) TaxID=574566 RepID=I0YXV0_COCSC|nr:agmatine deiminase [Coccomyxa subellipsoidea C-169]EIE23219.1 agmatine deiminase [Coccomyxa subellipsoidea C-169]|eukprot:XP_005647763.1 agmatine deiminase [Coccomyxa subellipsoidea C-169]